MEEVSKNNSEPGMLLLMRNEARGVLEDNEEIGKGIHRSKSE